MENKAYIIFKEYTKTGHIVPIGVISDKEIAIRETNEARYNYNDENIEIKCVECPHWENAADACLGIFHFMEEKKS